MLISVCSLSPSNPFYKPFSRMSVYENPELPLLAKCWRDVVALFVESHLLRGIPEAEMLAKWVIEDGVNKAVRRRTLTRSQMFRQVDASLDWGIGDVRKLYPYLRQIAYEMPKEPDAASEFLDSLERQGYLNRHHRIYLYQTYIQSWLGLASHIADVPSTPLRTP